MVIQSNRLYIRESPKRNAKRYFIFCEGSRREPHYFEYFQDMDSRIYIKVFHAIQGESHTPIGLFNLAKTILVKGDEQCESKFTLTEDDEVWFVIDTDDWESKIDELINLCKKYDNWFIAQSNPCFEVFLYYHMNSKIPKFDGLNKSSNWKKHLDKEIPGGFDSRKHPIFIDDANENSENNYKEINGKLTIGSTNLYHLTKKIYEITKEKIIDIRSQLEI